MSYDTCDCALSTTKWDPTNKICGRICPTDANAKNTFNPSFPNQCNCVDTFTWSLNKDKCVRNCPISSVTHIAGLDQSDITKCICDSTAYSYDSSSNTCLLICNSGFEYSDVYSKCVRICSIQNSTGVLSTNTDLCSCDSGYTFSTANYPNLCSINCALDPNAGTNLNAYTCNCLPNFVVNVTYTPPKCVRDCTSTIYSQNTFNPNDVTQCLCNIGYTWKTTSPYTNMCILNCQNIANTNGNANANTCVC